MRRLLAFIFLLVPLFIASSPAAAWTGNAAMSGTYVIDRSRSDDLNRAIEQAVARLSFVTRPIARGRLRRTNQPYQRIAIGMSASAISVAFDQRRPIITPANGVPISWTREDGEKLDVSTHWENAILRQIFRGEDGQRANAYSLSADGRVLTLSVTVTSPRLPGPMQYKLVYTRAS
jgi:hypothetical protein